MKKLLFPLVTAVILAAAAGLGLLLIPDDLDKAPDISLNFIDGRSIEFNSLQGKPLLVTFWSTTCSKCIQEMPHLIELYEELNKNGFEIIGIAMSYDPPNRVVELSERKNIPYPIALDIDGSASKAFGNIDVTPTSFLIGPQGNIVQQKTGELNIEDLRIKIKELLHTNLTTVS
jgi:peroxiredoxin